MAYVTRPHWFTEKVYQDRVNVLNLMDSKEIIVERPTNSFEPHYAETFIIPACV